MSSWLSDLALALPPVAPAALAAVSAAVIVVLGIPGCLGRHVYDELLEDVLKRRRANGWEPEVAVPAQPVSTPEPIAGESDGRLEAAVRDAAVRAESEIVLVRQEAALTLEHALAQARADAAAELAHVKQEAERTLATKLQEARSEITAAAEGRIADVRKEAEAALAQARADAVRETQTAAAVELARVNEEAEQTPVDVVSIVQNSAPTRKQTIEEHIQEARAKLARQKQDLSV